MKRKKYTIIIEETMEADNEEDAKAMAMEMQEDCSCEWEVTNTDINIGS